MKSKANRVIFLMQDVLELSTEHRMNTPGTCNMHNWAWRVSEKMLSSEIANKLYNLIITTGRI